MGKENATFRGDAANAGGMGSQWAADPDLPYSMSFLAWLSARSPKSPRSPLLAGPLLAPDLDWSHGYDTESSQCSKSTLHHRVRFETGAEVQAPQFAQVPPWSRGTVESADCPASVRNHFDTPHLRLADFHYFEGWSQGFMIPTSRTISRNASDLLTQGKCE